MPRARPWLCCIARRAAARVRRRQRRHQRRHRRLTGTSGGIDLTAATTGEGPTPTTGPPHLVGRRDRHRRLAGGDLLRARSTSRWCSTRASRSTTPPTSRRVARLLRQAGRRDRRHRRGSCRTSAPSSWSPTDCLLAARQRRAATRSSSTARPARSRRGPPRRCGLHARRVRRLQERLRRRATSCSPA